MSSKKQWITPFLKQSFVTLSVCLNLISMGYAFGFNASLFSSLRKTREIPLDRDAESWLASTIGPCILIGAICGSFIMKYLGRRPIFIVSPTLMIISWIIVTLSSSFLQLLIAKILQGTAIGVSGLGPNLISEYSSPKYRASFVATLPTGLLSGELLPHCLGLYYDWHLIALILAFFTIPGLVLTIISPETPTFLVIKGRYDESRKVFHWLRGLDEDEELDAMIKTDMIIKESKKKRRYGILRLLKNKLKNAVMVLRKREFRVPVIIMMHLNAINQFCGTFINDMYTIDIHTAIYGTDIYMFQVASSLDVLRLVSTALTIFITSKVRRRPLLLALVGSNIAAYLLIAGYIYAKRNHFLPFDHISIGILLHHFHFFSLGTGSMSLPFIISGEIYPLAYKECCVILSSAQYSLYFFLNMKTAPYIFSLVGIDGTFCVYALILLYCLVVTLYLLPETKDRTLQDIENEFRGYAIGDESGNLNCDNADMTNEIDYE